MALAFVNFNKINEYYELIRNKFKKDFPKFFEYFKKYYLKSKPFSDKCWNYNKLEKEGINIEKKFFTNNFVESCNRTLNQHYIGGIKTFLHFEKAIFDLIDLYQADKEYKESKFNITRSLSFYALKNENVNCST